MVFLDEKNIKGETNCEQASRDFDTLKLGYTVAVVKTYTEVLKI